MIKTLKGIWNLLKLIPMYLDYFEKIGKNKGVWFNHDNQIALLNASAHLLERQNEMLAQLESLKQGSATIQRRVASRLHQTANPYLKRNPEVSLFGHLYGYLTERVALDIGANAGEFSEKLLSAGYAVYAFEPYTPIFEELKRRLADQKNFHAFNLAISDSDGRAKLHLAEETSSEVRYEAQDLYHTLIPHPMPIGLEFSRTVEVPVRSLDSLLISSEIPAAVGLIKIDTEGNELNVLRGLGGLKAEVVMTEFWDEKHVFGGRKMLNKLSDVVGEMQRLGFPFYLPLYRTDDPDHPQLFCHYHQPPDTSWGNVLFFREQVTYEAALSWCQVYL